MSGIAVLTTVSVWLDGRPHIVGMGAAAVYGFVYAGHRGPRSLVYSHDW